MGAKPAAGPLTVTYDPPRNGRTKPAMIADVMPVIGGAPDATAMPSENGSEISDTTRPAKMSCRQCFNPWMPFWGFSRVIDVGFATRGGEEVACMDGPLERT